MHPGKVGRRPQHLGPEGYDYLLRATVIAVIGRNLEPEVVDSAAFMLASLSAHVRIYGGSPWCTKSDMYKYLMDWLLRFFQPA
jgi:hypothetical protein